MKRFIDDKEMSAKAYHLVVHKLADETSKLPPSEYTIQTFKLFEKVTVISAVFDVPYKVVQKDIEDCLLKK